MKYDYVILISLIVLWFPAPVTLLGVSRKLDLEDVDAFLKGNEEFDSRQDIWSSLHTFCDLHCGKNNEILTEEYESANMSAANIQVGSRLFQKLYPRASSKRPGARDIPSGWEVFVKLAATACDLHSIHALNDQEINTQYQNKNENRFRRQAFAEKPTYKRFLGDISAFLPLVQWNIPSNRFIWLPSEEEKEKM
ncbi:uncharacterized protein LOC125045404 [Penaeus chinensis]|uniref:uncharacterized protein LOC125045404 n=1 Tax=Penaeus chinensis TaxID=139456 RepID=UPI001FB58B87|nr:uncharacterized protein LOC125045404 [Penaeus chinensis]